METFLLTTLRSTESLMISINNVTPFLSFPNCIIVNMEYTRTATIVKLSTNIRWVIISNFVILVSWKFKKNNAKHCLLNETVKW